ncbi:hypothetical protein GCK32_011936 [Trichostrongylus colubriformis]|uniref:Uncharacterized protein n=1 Tax=Trichostrongylus colubriformis TaxID=6319 RepID=A0AAN8ICL0_TRICO
MFVIKLIAFLCILAQAKANKPEKLVTQDTQLDAFSLMIFGLNVNELQHKHSQGKNTKLWYDNNVQWNDFKKKFFDSPDSVDEEKQFASTLASTLQRLGYGMINKSQAMNLLNEEWGRMPKTAQDKWTNDVTDFVLKGSNANITAK